jgi:hypothetical protein
MGRPVAQAARRPEVTGPQVRLLFEPRDLWVGIYWRVIRFYQPPRRPRRWDIYICLIPTLPIRVRWYK